MMHRTERNGDDWEGGNSCKSLLFTYSSLDIYLMILNKYFQFFNMYSLIILVHQTFLLKMGTWKCYLLVVESLSILKLC
jgi:hypothetical protein